MFNSTRLKIGVPMALLFAAAVAALALWAFMGGATGGLTDSAGIKGTVQWSVFDSAGNLKQQYVNHNVDVAVIHNAARARLGVNGTTIGDNDLFDNIQACITNVAGGLCSSGTGLTTGLDANPADGTNAAGGAGIYTTTKTFTASAAAVIEELQLTSGAAANTVEEIAGAYQDVSITLAATDTLQVTWTITVS